MRLESLLYLPSNSVVASRSNSTENICIQIRFGPPLAGLCNNDDKYMVIGHWRAAEGRSGTLVWRAAKGRLYGLVCWRVYGGRPKAAIEIAALTVGGWPKGALACCLLILALAFRKSTAPSKHFKRSVAIQQKAFVFRFRLARLWRALISSIYIYIILLFFNSQFLQLEMT